ncbi:hypothetical protein BJ508DRAFT_322723 [Ascobolus immersus RN42]|uniref:Lytic polysaccharide monooxygenase n=1 Tax=Ascobolus immersus RN42 TaxID=1160509 RepID=A0A3N4IMB7_ASCIM|nr:hypothetical protein BJ508DRAFT_322723 [Ascobolus immersus RN42]
MRVSLVYLAFVATNFGVSKAHLAMTWPRMIQYPEEYGIMGPVGSWTEYPCHGGHLSNSGPVTPVTAGNKGLVKIEGRANGPHRGGSCQISISEDKGVTFRTIKDIIGGCPQNTEHFGYLSPLVPEAFLDYQYTTDIDYTLPKYVSNGKHILAWTWYNAVGNREFYMKCAWVNVQGGTGQGLKSKPDDHPEIYLDRMFSADAEKSSSAMAGVNPEGTGNLCLWKHGEEAIFPKCGKDVVWGDSFEGISPALGVGKTCPTSKSQCAATPGSSKPRAGLPTKLETFKKGVGRLDLKSHQLVPTASTPTGPGVPTDATGVASSGVASSSAEVAVPAPTPSSGVNANGGATVEGTSTGETKAGGETAGGTANGAPANGAPAEVVAQGTADTPPSPADPVKPTDPQQSVPADPAGSAAAVVPSETPPLPAQPSPPVDPAGDTGAAKTECEATPAVVPRSPGHPGEDGEHEDCECEEDDTVEGKEVPPGALKAARRRRRDEDQHNEDDSKTSTVTPTVIITVTEARSSLAKATTEAKRKLRRAAVWFTA